VAESAIRREHGPTWVENATGGAYDVDNLPYAVFSVGGDQPRVGTRIGDLVVDLAPIAATDMMAGAEALAQPTLAGLLSAGRPTWTSTRSWLISLFTDEAERAAVEPFLIPIDEVTVHPPFEVADYVDFYASLDHASNTGRIFRPDQEPLLPNWRHLPVGYHGRAGSVVISGTDIVRPCGQRMPVDADAPTYGPTQRLDIEAELGYVVGVPTRLGERVPTGGFADHVFGVTLLNDWSARDIQGWEARPLGPFLGKSFATSISPWITPLEALDAARVDLPPQDPQPLPYLRVDDPAGYDIEVEIRLGDEVIARAPYSAMYWSPAQMLAHLTVNGAPLRTGDLYASGTISGSEPRQQGSLLELTWGGTEPITLSDGTTRAYLDDGDTVTLTATAAGARGGRLALGSVAGTVLPGTE
jgi:fumarylacetoacetase